jgi:hypothetical protein
VGNVTFKLFDRQRWTVSMVDEPSNAGATVLLLSLLFGEARNEDRELLEGCFFLRLFINSYQRKE